MPISLTEPARCAFTAIGLWLNRIHAAFEIGLIASIRLFVFIPVDLVLHALTTVLTRPVQTAIHRINERQNVGLVFQAFIWREVYGKEELVILSYLERTTELIIPNC